MSSREFEDDVHQIVNVLDTGGMVMKIDDNDSLMQQHGLVEVVVRSRPIRGVRRGISVGVSVLEGVWVAEGGLGAHLGGALDGVTSTLSGGGDFIFNLLGVSEGGVTPRPEFLWRVLLALAIVGDPAIGAARDGACSTGGRHAMRPQGPAREAEAREGSES
jgi:hypothetical protein